MGVKKNLCNPSAGLHCFQCCPPIRPPGYDHLDHEKQLRRFFRQARRDILEGLTPQKEIIGFSCPGLGFLDDTGRTVGCLLHPARNQGKDLRAATGYAEKCARETCSEARAYKLLPMKGKEHLVDFCQGMDSFVFSSRKANPAMRLLGFGPDLAGRVFQALSETGAELPEMAWLYHLAPWTGWFVELAAKAKGEGFLLGNEVTARVEEGLALLARNLPPQPPYPGGEPLYRLCPEWEARFWLKLLQRGRLSPQALLPLRDAARAVIEKI